MDTSSSGWMTTSGNIPPMPSSAAAASTTTSSSLTSSGDSGNSTAAGSGGGSSSFAGYPSQLLRLVKLYEKSTTTKRRQQQRRRQDQSESESELPMMAMEQQNDNEKDGVVPHSSNNNNNNNDGDEDYDDDSETILQNIVDLMNHLIVMYSRYGLFQGNSENAERVLSSSSASASKSTSATKDGTGGHNNRKKGGKNNRGSLLGGGGGSGNFSADFSSSLDPFTDSTSSGTTAEETLVFTAILRILQLFNGTTTSGKSSSSSSKSQNGQPESKPEPSLSRTVGTASPSTNQDHAAVLVSLVSELVVALSQKLLLSSSSEGQRHHDVVTCNVATYELLTQNGKVLLTGFITAMESIVEDISWRHKIRSAIPTGNKVASLSSSSSSSTSSSSSSDSMRCRLSLMAPLDDDLHTTPLTSLLKVTTLLVGLFGTRLSRSTAVLGSLRSISWKILMLPNESIQDGAARLLSSLPLAGGVSGVTGTDRNTPSEIWTESFMGAVIGLPAIIHNVTPVGPSTRTDDSFRRQVDSSSSIYCEWYGSVMINEWLDEFRRHVQNDDDRVKCFNLFTRGLSRLLHFLLLQDGIGSDFANSGSSSSSLTSVQIDIPSVLSLIENLLAFPLTAETVYFKTKRRLRDVAVDGGLLSPTSIATRVANCIKRMGHDILDSLLTVLSVPVLLPYARRVVRISYASLLTSSSGPVRKAMDPTSAAQLDGKKRRWLHLSVPMRRLTIESLTKVIAKFGPDASGSSRQKNSSRKGYTKSNARPSTDGEKSISLVVGCLIEEIGRMVDTFGFDEDWVSNTDRIDLVLSCVECLYTSLASFGGFMSIACRSLIESAILTALSGICRSHPSPYDVLSCCQVKVSFLRLGSACALTPWKDGASSSLLTDGLARAASTLRNDSEPSVVIAATSALNVCDTINVPRAPPLLFVTRTTTVGADKSSQLATISSKSSGSPAKRKNADDVDGDAQDFVQEEEQEKEREKDEEIKPLKKKVKPETVLPPSIKLTNTSSKDNTSGAKVTSRIVPNRTCEDEDDDDEFPEIVDDGGPDN